jgi:hypothetical protein
MMPNETVERVLCELLGKPCWNARHGYGTFLTFEFGEPRLEIYEPREPFEPGAGRKRRVHQRRQAYVRGARHLWIYCCDWTVVQDDKVIADSDGSDTDIERAARALNGQALVAVDVDPSGRASRFTFDLGGVLETRAWANGADGPYEQWMLAEPSGYWLSIRDDSRYSFHPGDTPPEQAEWLPL